MNWDAISAVSETVSSIAVIISLVYLALQIRQSNKLSQSQTRIELRHMANAEVTKLVEHPEIWPLTWKETLTIEEKSRLYSFLVGALRFREFIWRQYRMGLLDQRTFEHYIRVVIQLLSSDRTWRWWKNYNVTGTFDPEFVAYVEKMVSENPRVDLKEIIESL